MTKFKF